MSKRPLSVTVGSWIFIVFGSIMLFTTLLPGFRAEAREAMSQHPFASLTLYVGLILAVVCGAFMLRGSNWARWLLAVWFGYNVLGNVLQSPSRLWMPGGLFFILVWSLFRSQATAYFRGTRVELPPVPKTNDTPVA